MDLPAIVRSQRRGQRRRQGGADVQHGKRDKLLKQIVCNNLLATEPLVSVKISPNLALLYAM